MGEYVLFKSCFYLLSDSSSSSGTGEKTLRVHLGFEYECPRGHRFFSSAPDKVFKAPASGVFKVCSCLPLPSILLVQVRLRTEVPSTQSSTQLGFELMTSRSWQYISCHWDACSNYSAISDFPFLLVIASWAHDVMYGTQWSYWDQGRCH